jgi:hypothetical protein
MMNSPEEEQDLKLKLRLMRYLWHLGYLVRKNVILVESFDKRDPYTDIDVLAVKVDNELNSNYIVCDCKSGARTKTRERLFWLSGVMDYFDAGQGIFLRSKLFEIRYADLATRLNITPLSEEKLSELEKAYRIDKGRSIGAFSEEYRTGDQTLAGLRKFQPKVAEYIDTWYWNDPPSEQVNNLVACSKRIIEVSQLSVRARMFLLAHVFSDLSLSALQFSKGILNIPASNIEEYAKIELLGGSLEHEERKRLLKGFHEFMTKEIEARYKARYPISSTQFIESFVPEHSKYFIELVARICGNPEHSFLIPRFFDLVAFETILGNRNVNIEDLLPVPLKEDLGTLLKPVVDFVAFVERSGLLDRELKEVLNQQLAKS